MQDLIRMFHWSSTPLGERERWSKALQTSVSICLNSGSPILILWGNEMVGIYNDSYREIIGEKHPHAFGAPAKVVWGELWNEIGPMLESVLKEGKSILLENHHFILTRKGFPEDCYFTFSYSPIYEGNDIAGIFVSLTETTQAEGLEKLITERARELLEKNAQLKQSEERYHKMVEEVEDYAIILLTTEGIIETWNRGAEKIKGYKERQILGSSFTIFYLPEDRERKLPEQLLEEARIRGKVSHEGWRVRKDGSKFWGNVTITALHNHDNEVIGFSKVTRDLTERKLAEEQQLAFTEELKQRNEELKKSEERYHMMIAEVQDYAIILLNEHGDIENWNAGAEFIKGYSAKEIVGRNFKIFYSKEDRDSNLPQTLLNEAAQKGKAVHEGWRVRKDGSRFWGSIVLTALHGTGGQIVGFSKVTRDLTERKITEGKLREYTAELESQNKELEQFAYVASHDLQEPLRKIQTFTELIQKNINNVEIVKKYFERISASSQRMSDLIHSVLNYSRLSKDSVNMIDVDLNSILENVKTDFELLIEEKGAVILNDPLPVIKGIPLQISQIFTNLVSNALKFTATEPLIRVTSRIVPREEIKGNPGHLYESYYLELSFSDNGIGFDQKYEKQIFDMFQRLHGKHQYAGTGIGLALCKKIIEGHNGYIAAKSEPGKGATFFIYFPYHPASTAGN